MDNTPVRGAVFKLFGVVLISLGLLNSMLSWRGSMGLSGFQIGLFAAGIFFFAIGAIRHAARGQSQ